MSFVRGQNRCGRSSRGGLNGVRILINVPCKVLNGVPVMRFSQHPAEGCWIFPHRNVNYHVQAKNAHTLPNTRLQKRRPSGDLGTPSVFVAFHAVLGSQLCGNAARNGVRQCSPRTAARDYGLHHHQRRIARSRRYQRVAPDG